MAMNDTTRPPVETPPETRVRTPPEAPVRAPVVSRRRVWLIVVVIAVAIAAIIAWFVLRPAADAPAGKGRGGFDPNTRVMPVVAATVRKGSIDVNLDALGTVTPRNTVVVRSRVDGQLLGVGFREGQDVKKGEVLAQIDPRPFEVQLTQATGQMAKDQALLKNAQLDLERYQTLLKQDSISKQQVDTQAALVRQYQGAVESDQGAIDNAKLQITYARITAPISGRVGLRQVDPGNMVHASDSNGLVTITQIKPITVIYPVPEDNVPRIIKRMQGGQDVAVDAYDRSGKNKLATGRLLTFDNQIDTATGTVKVKAEFPNDDAVLFPNQFVNVRMAIETRQDATLAPSAAIQRGAPGTFVFVVKPDQTVSVTPVKIGAVEGETTEIQSGLDAGAQVVVDGADKLREGSKVEVVDAKSRAVPPAGTPARRSPEGADKGSNKGNKGRRSQNGG
jgi:multidrug efflux system membrane fusion protein